VDKAVLPKHQFVPIQPDEKYEPSGKKSKPAKLLSHDDLAYGWLFKHQY
jgi:hypothetical protein